MKQQFHWTMATVRSRYTELKMDMTIPLRTKLMVVLMLLVNVFLDEACYIFTITNSLAISVAT